VRPVSKSRCISLTVRDCWAENRATADAAGGDQYLNDSIQAFARRMEETSISTLEHIRDRHFTNERVEFDGKRFTSCKFEACTLVYDGGDVEFGPGCEVGNCRPEFSGSARKTVLLLHALGLLSFNPHGPNNQGASIVNGVTPTPPKASVPH
jgi:hypothetical protein